MPRWFQPIATRRARISWTAVSLVNLPWGCQMFSVFVQTNAIVLTMRHYTADTRLLALVGSLWPALGATLGPVFNYLSDHSWIRWGNRRPFIVAGWTAAAAAMAVLALQREWHGFSVVVVFYAVAIQLATPLEPLCMELLPLPQRGRALAMRTVAVQVVTLVYFQGLFPLFDRLFALPAWVPIVGLRPVSGEQIIYFTASAFFLSMVAFLVLGVRETPPPAGAGAAQAPPLKRPGAAIRRFVADVFGDRRWWWIYGLSLFGSGTMLSDACWSGMGVLLTTEQFGYSKMTVALMGLPMIVFSMAAVTPFMGWYSDRLPRISYKILLPVSAGSALLAVHLGRVHLPGELRELPSLAWTFILSGLAGLAATAFYIAVVQSFLSTGKSLAGTRAWIAYLGVGLQAVFAVAAWVLIKHGTRGGVPPALTWLLFTQFTGVVASANGVVTAPLLFDFIPRDKMGTISSGLGIVGGLSSAVMANVGGVWIFLSTTHGASGQSADYASIYLCQALVGAVAFLCLTFFVRAVRRGQVVEFGRLGLASAEAPAPIR